MNLYILPDKMVFLTDGNAYLKDKRNPFAGLMECGFRWWPVASDLTGYTLIKFTTWSAVPSSLDIPAGFPPEAGYISPFGPITPPKPIVIPPPPPILPLEQVAGGAYEGVDPIDINSVTGTNPPYGQAQMLFNIGVLLTHAILTQENATISVNPHTYLVKSVSINSINIWEPSLIGDAILGAYIDSAVPIYINASNTVKYHYTKQGTDLRMTLADAGTIIPVRLISDGAASQRIFNLFLDYSNKCQVDLAIELVDEEGSIHTVSIWCLVGYARVNDDESISSIYVPCSPLNGTYQSLVSNLATRQKLLFGISNTCSISSTLDTIKSTFSTGNTEGIFSLSVVEGMPSTLYVAVMSEAATTIQSDYNLGSMIIRGSTIVEGELYLGTTDPTLASPSFRVWKFDIPPTYATNQVATFDFVDPYGDSYLPSFSKLDITDMNGADLITFAPAHDGKSIGLSFNITDNPNALLLLTKLPDGSDVEISSTNLVTTVGQPKTLNCVLRGLSKRIHITSLSLVRNTAPVTTPITSPALWASAIASDYAITFDGNDIVTTSPTVTTVSSDITIIEKSYSEVSLDILFDPTTVLGNPLLNVNRRLTITIKGDILDNLGAVITSNAVLGTLMIKGSVS